MKKWKINIGCLLTIDELKQLEKIVPDDESLTEYISNLVRIHIQDKPKNF